MADSKRFLLIWLDEPGSIQRPSLTPIRWAIEDLVKAKPSEVEIDIWLESRGGDAHAAYKLALLLQAVSSKIRVVVPDYAKSAATLLSLAGDEIYLAPGADLGPLDAQMPDEGSVTGSISALNIAHAADEVARDAVDMAVSGTIDLLNITGLSRAQTIDAMLRFSSGFSEPLVRQLDPKVVHHAKQMLQVTAKYAEHLLGQAGHRDPRRIAKALVETFPTHGYVISLTEASNMGLPARPIAEYEFLDKVREVHRTSETGTSIVKFCSLDSIIKPKEGENSEERKEGGVGNGRPSRARSAEAKRSGATPRTSNG